MSSKSVRLAESARLGSETSEARSVELAVRIARIKTECARRGMDFIGGRRVSWLKGEADATMAEARLKRLGWKLED